tara:strand:- start:53 stop:949 length:897 start_codon:yes stop_codon:yes gene_type:complete
MTKTSFTFIIFFLGVVSIPNFAQNPNILRLSEQLESNNRSVRRQAAISLGQASFPQSVKLLRSAFSREIEIEIRLEIVKALRHIVFQRYPGYREALYALGDASNAEKEENNLIRLRASQALWEASKKDLLNPVSFLKRNLNDPNAELRLSAVGMLRKIGSPETIEALGQTAIDKNQDETVRLKAIEAIGAISLSDPGLVGREIATNNRKITEMLGQPPLFDENSIQKRHQSQISYLTQVANNPSNSNTLVLRAVKSIGQVKDKSSIESLEIIINTHKDPAVKKQAIRVLSHIIARQYE